MHYSIRTIAHLTKEPFSTASADRGVIGFVAISVEPGLAAFQGTPGFQYDNPSGAVHGGYAATLLDMTIGCAIHSTLPAGKGFTTLELKVTIFEA